MDAAPRNFWVDTDIALGAERGDVDDGFALSAVFAAVQRWPDRYRLLGVSATEGNTSAATAGRCATELAAEFGLPLAVSSSIPGAQLPSEAHLLCLGPLGNLAALVDRHPQRARDWRVSVVGNLHHPRRHPLLRLMDLNARRNPAAWRSALEAPFAQRRQFPLDAVRALTFGAEDLAQLAALGGPAAYLAAHSQRWLRQTLWRHPSRRFPVWDLVAALAALDLLPAARWDGEQLASFDCAAAHEGFFDLLRA